MSVRDEVADASAISPVESSTEQSSTVVCYCGFNLRTGSAEKESDYIPRKLTQSDDESCSARKYSELKFESSCTRRALQVLMVGQGHGNKMLHRAVMTLSLIFDKQGRLCKENV